MADSCDDVADNGKLDRRQLLARVLCWAGMLVPAGVLEARSPVVVAEDPFTAITLFRGLFPAACLALALGITPRGHLLTKPSGRELILAGYLAVVVASTAWSLAPRLTLLKAGHLCVAYALLVLLARQWRDRRQALAELTIVLSGVTVLAAAAAAVVPDRAFRAGRLVGVYPGLESVVLGILAAVALVAASAHMLGRPRAAAAPWAAAALISATVMLLTRTRSALVLVVVAVLVLLWLHGRGRTAAVVGASVVTAAVTVVALPQAAFLRETFLRGATTSELLSFSGRFPLWGDALATVSHRPLVGYGYFAGHRFGLYAELYARRYGNAPYVDGTWVETMLDLGVLGVVALAVFVAGCCRSIWRWRAVGARFPLHAALLVMMLAYSIQDFTLQQVGYPMAALGTLLLAPADRAQSAPERRAEQDRTEEVHDEPTVVREG